MFVFQQKHHVVDNKQQLVNASNSLSEQDNSINNNFRLNNVLTLDSNESATSKFEITLTVLGGESYYIYTNNKETEQMLITEYFISIEYNTDLFEKNTVDRMIDNYCVLLKSIEENEIRQIDKKLKVIQITDLELLIEEEKFINH